MKTVKALRKFLGMVLILALLAGPVLGAAAQGEPDKYFPQTGFWVKGEFWQFYNNLDNADILLGYPISQEFTSVDGKTVQYFQKARLELDVTQSVRLSPIGEALRKAQEAAGKLEVYNPMGCKLFSETGFSVCYDFLTFFEANGGVAHFGNPLTPFEYHDNLIVQYFQNGRLEWQPWKPEGQKVTVGDLGKAYFLLVNENPSALDVEDGGNLQKLLTLRPRVFTLKPVTRSDDQQTLFIVAQDQVWKPVAGAEIAIKVTWPDGSLRTDRQVTNAFGVVRYELPVKNQPIGGIVLVDVVVSFGGVEGKTSASFRIWY
jgi:hypothetical protein